MRDLILFDSIGVVATFFIWIAGSIAQIQTDQQFVQLTFYHQSLERLTPERAAAGHRVCGFLENNSVSLDYSKYSFCADWGYDVRF